MSARRDSGLGLIEVLVTIVFLGTVVTSVLGAMGVAVRGADTARSRTRQAAWLQTSADYLHDLTFVACTGTDGATAAASYQSSLRATNAPAAPSGWSRTQLEVVTVRSWNGTAFVTTCVPSARLQQIELRARDRSSRASTSLVVAKGRYDQS